MERGRQSLCTFMESPCCLRLFMENFAEMNYKSLQGHDPLEIYCCHMCTLRLMIRLSDSSPNLDKPGRHVLHSFEL